MTPRSSALPDPKTLVLLDAELLPDGYRRSQVHVMRTGLADRGTPWADRLRAARGRSARAAFRHDEDPLAFVASQAMPMLSADDAADAFATVNERLLRNPDPGLTELGREPLELAVRLGDEHDAFRLRCRNAAYPDREGEQLCIAWRQESVVAFMTVADETGSWSVEDVEGLARLQAARIANALEADE